MRSMHKIYNDCGNICPSYSHVKTKFQHSDIVNDKLFINNRFGMKSLDQIALKFGTDKSSFFHNYTRLYELYFEGIRYEKLKIFEIGIQDGFSLKTWEEYFPNAEIIGIDIVNLKHLEKERVHVEQGDQTDPIFLKKINDKYGPFDIIIDDGSHHNDDMKASFECLFPMLKDGGLYIVEDLHACYRGKEYGDDRAFIHTLKNLIDSVQSSGKSQCANVLLDKKEDWVKMDWWEKNTEFLHIYRSIVFIKKYSSGSDKTMFGFEMHDNAKKPGNRPFSQRLKIVAKTTARKILLVFISQENISKYKNKIYHTLFAKK